MAFRRSRTEPNTTVTVGHLGGEGALGKERIPISFVCVGGQPAGGSGRRKTRDAADIVAHAVAHRLRVDILTVLHDGPASQKELSAQLHEPLSNITHHINELSDANAIEVAFTKKVGNVEQNYWRAVTTSCFWSPDDLAALTIEEHEVLSRIIVQSITAEMLAALRAGHLAGDPYAATAWDRVWLDERGYRDLNEATGTFLARMYDAAAESATRAAETGEQLKSYVGAVMAFRRSRTEPNTTVTVGHSGIGSVFGNGITVREIGMDVGGPIWNGGVVSSHRPASLLHT